MCEISHKMKIMNKDAAVKARGERISKLRKETRLSRVDFCKKYDIPETTMKAWEYGTSGSIAADGLLQLLRAFKNENVNCTADYLLVGEAQTAPYGYIQDPMNDKPINDKWEIEIFYATNKHAFHAYAPDNLMSPALKKGDLALGIPWDLDDLKSIFNSICIVQLLDESVLIRTLLPSNKRDFFVLQSLKEDDLGVLILSKAEIKRITLVVKMLRTSQ